MKLILVVFVIILSLPAFSFLIPNPSVSFDIQLQQDPTKKRESFIKFSNEYYVAYLADFRKINNLTTDPFMPSLRNELNEYFKHLTENEVNALSNEQVITFMREQLADQLYIPYSKENSEALINEASDVLKKTSVRIDQLELKLFNQINSSKKVKLGNTNEGIPLDFIYLTAIVILAIIIFLLTLQKNKKAK